MIEGGGGRRREEATGGGGEEQVSDYERGLTDTDSKGDRVQDWKVSVPSGEPSVERRAKFAEGSQLGGRWDGVRRRRRGSMTAISCHNP